MQRGGRSYIISSQCRDHRSWLQQDLKMRPANDIDSRVAPILAKESEVKQLRVDAHARKIDVGFYSPPSLELFQRVEMQVRREFDGEWEISVQPSAPSPLFHRHQINDHITEFHRAHPAVEPRLIWKRIPLPKWRNRPVPPATIRDYRIMLALVGTCGISALAGFALQRAAYPGWPNIVSFTVAYIAGGWFATQDVWLGLKQRRIDVQFLMIFVALGAATVRAWIEGATSADESALTGESLPVPKGVGDSVSSGTLNLDGQAVIRASREEQESALQRILSLIQTAQQQKAPAQRFTDSFSRYYTWVALSLSALLFVILLSIHKPLAEAFYRTMTLLVVASPLRAGLVDSICDSGR